MTGSDIITDAEFAKLRVELAPDAADSWRQIPWHVSLAQALSVAGRENKLLAMVVRSGHPLGCTCNNGLIDRASITGNPEIANLLATRFIPVAIDQHIHRRLHDAEGRLFAELVKRAGQFLDGTAQGFYVFTGAGGLLAFRHTQDPFVVKQMLTSAEAIRRRGARPRLGVRDNGRAPRGRYPLAIRFTLAQGAWPFDNVPPGAARTRASEYLGMAIEPGSRK